MAVPRLPVHRESGKATLTFPPPSSSSCHPFPPSDHQGGIESADNYPYCSGSGKCFPCVPKGYNKTRCGPAPEYCNQTQSCAAKLNPAEFVSGLKVKSWVAIAKVTSYSVQ